MTFPKTTWVYSDETEALRILQTAYHIKNGFYSQNGFLVLPYVPTSNPKVIYFPHLSLKSPDLFWKKARFDSETLKQRNDPVIETVKATLKNKSLDCILQKRSWQKVEKIFFREIKVIVPAFFKGISEIEIRPTRFGSVATAYSTWTKERQKIIVYLRHDADFSHIAEGILLDRLHLLHGSKYSWQEIEAIIDFILSKTKLKKIFPYYKETLSSLNQKQQGKLTQESLQYQKKLGMISKDAVTISDGGSIMVLGKKASSYLTANEKKVLRQFILNRGRIVTFDDIAQSIWGNEHFDRYSEYAIVKLVQRIREKLKKLGAFQNLIQTVKKEGYVLF